MKKVNKNIKKHKGHSRTTQVAIHKKKVKQRLLPTFTYELVLFFLSDLPLKFHFLKSVVHEDIGTARKISFQLYKAEQDWLKFQPDTPHTSRMGVALILQFSSPEKRELIVESSYDRHSSLTIRTRKKEKAIFRKLGKEYPERNFAEE